MCKHRILNIVSILVILLGTIFVLIGNYGVDKNTNENESEQHSRKHLRTNLKIAGIILLVIGFILFITNRLQRYRLLKIGNLETEEARSPFSVTEDISRINAKINDFQNNILNSKKHSRTSSIHSSKIGNKNQSISRKSSLSDNSEFGNRRLSISRSPSISRY